jgi:hypothetical protein
MHINVGYTASKIWIWSYKSTEAMHSSLKSPILVVEAICMRNKKKVTAINIQLWSCVVIHTNCLVNRMLPQLWIKFRSREQKIRTRGRVVDPTKRLIIVSDLSLRTVKNFTNRAGSEFLVLAKAKRAPSCQLPFSITNSCQQASDLKTTTKK